MPLKDAGDLSFVVMGFDVENSNDLASVGYVSRQKYAEYPTF